MEDKIKNVSLTFCCNKEWAQLSPADNRRRFCDSCQHHVVDFTRGTKQELEQALRGAPRLCGRFTRSQMSAHFLRYAAVTVVATSLCSSCETEIQPAEVKPPVENSMPFPEPSEQEIEFVGLVFDPADTLIHESDSLMPSREIIPEDSTHTNGKVF